MRRTTHRARARARILAAAVSLFLRKGIENVTFGDIAKRARLSRPLVYFYFPDLRSLLMEAALESNRRLDARFRKALAGAPNGLEATAALGRAYLAFHDEDPEYFHLCMAVAPGCAPAGPLCAAERTLLAESRATLRLVGDQIIRGRRDGSVDPKAGPPLLVAICLWSLSHGLARFAATKAPALAGDYRIAPADVLAAGMELLRRGIAAPRRGTRKRQRN